jgi:tetratricopeptide (TPR) repeat protein
MMSFALNHIASGYELRGFHLVNIAIHILSGVLVYFLARRIVRLAGGLRGQPEVPGGEAAVATLSALTALLFVAHPVQTQAVTYIVQRMTSMAGMFYLLALLLYIAGRERRAGRARAGLWIGCAASGLLAFGSKQTAAPLPVAILLVEWFFFRDLSAAWLRRSLRWAVPAAVALLAFALLYLRAGWALGYGAYDFTLAERLFTQLRVVVFYLGLLAFPHPSRLNLLHDISTSHSLVDPISTLLSASLLATLAALAVVLARRERLLSFSILWFFLHLAVESTAIPIEMVYEHRLYLPMFGVSLAVVWLLFRIGGRRREIAAGAAVAMIALLALGTYARNETWRSATGFWADVAAKSPGNTRAVYNLGVAFARAGRDAEATRAYEELVRLDPEFRDGHLRLGMARALAGRMDEAAAHFREELRLYPDTEKAKQLLEIVLRQAERAERSDAPD